MRKMVIGMHHLNVSQCQWMPYDVSSHHNVPAVDLAGSDIGRDYWKALDGKYKSIGTYGGANGTGFIPIDANNNPEQTEAADGSVDYYGIYLVHDNNAHKAGVIYNVGDVMYTEGTKGLSYTGTPPNHIHCEVFKFNPSNPVLPARIVVTSGTVGAVPGGKPLQTSRFPDGVYLDPSELWYASDYTTVVKIGASDGGWKQSFGVTTLADARDSSSPIPAPITNDVIVTKVQQETGYEYRLSVDGNKYGTSGDHTSWNLFHDHTLEDDGWEECIKSNGSIFYYYDNECFAEGVEKSRGVNNQGLDMSCVSKFNDTMSIGCGYNGEIVFDKQSAIISKLDYYYGAVTGMFGIMKDGVRTEWGRELEDQRNHMYTNKSGRTIIGWSSVTHEYIWITIAGETGSAGKTGAELFDIAKNAGCTDALCMDGGGSVFLVKNGQPVVTTTRLVKNAVILYRRKISTPVITADRMNGIDISDWQRGIDLSKVNADFVICKATEGLSYISPDFKRQADQTLSSGKLLGIYHYSQGKDPVQEANHFIDSITDYLGKAVLFLDWEGKNNVLFRSSQDAAWITSFSERIKEKVGASIIVYVQQSAMSYVQPTGLQMWVAQYANDKATSYQSHPWNEGAYACAIRQYSSHGRIDGYPNDLDINLAYFGKDKWIDMTAINIPTPDPTPTDDKDTQIASLKKQVADLSAENAALKTRIAQIKALTEA